ncbi:MAG: 16S rRNA (cytosine(1402)-N(4))-methyltransferase RsmH [Chloroflexi bacterium]|nr:16S rRNA (cytosine(1402)-N(4))-methyltransferase RsmH [Chloroflexota bacterium]
MKAPTPGDSSPHLPVLYQEVIQALQPVNRGRYLDATLGAGGHSWGILTASSPAGEVLGLDVDPQALAIASQRLSVFGSRAHLVEASYVTLLDQIQALGWQTVDGIVIDLGVSSMQVDTPERGFSFLADGPLDMRFSPIQPTTAADLVNHLSEQDLSEIVWKYGEERHARRVARAIVENRPFSTTAQLAALIARSLKGQHERIHPATRTFQALRIAVNQELQALEDFLPRALQALHPGGRLAVISFHSLEDRIVKQVFKRESQDCICPPEQIICTCGHKAQIRLITRRPVMAGEDEIQNNPRARSARLRIAEKI